MEYAKDIILDIKDGQAVERKIKTERQLKRSGLGRRILAKISEHKVISSIVTATISFIVIDALLIISFVNVLLKL